MWYHNANKHLIVFHLILNCGKLTHGATASLDQPRYETGQASPARQGSSVWSTPLRPQVWPGFVYRADTLDRSVRQTYLPQGYALAVSGRYDQRSPRTYKAENEAIKYMSYDKDHSKDKFGTPDFDLQGAQGGFLSGLHRAFGSSVRKMFDSVGLEEQAKNPPISFLQPLARVTVSVDGSQVFGRSSVWKTALAASPMMSAYDALLQAKILYDFTHPENTTTNPFRVILEPSMKRQCYIVKQVGDVSTTPLFQWSLTVISRSKEVLISGPCVPSKKRVVVLPGFSIRLDYAPIPRFFF